VSGLTQIVSLQSPTDGLDIPNRWAVSPIFFLKKLVMGHAHFRYQFFCFFFFKKKTLSGHLFVSNITYLIYSRTLQKQHCFEVMATISADQRGLLKKNTAPIFNAAIACRNSSLSFFFFLINAAQPLIYIGQHGFGFWSSSLPYGHTNLKKNKIKLIYDDCN
jgi:hypothetical protein